MANTIWEILGISPTTDKKAIKKAYSIKSASCHPEDSPEAFEQLHNAYITALKAAAIIASVTGASGSSPAPDSPQEEDNQDEDTQDEEEETGQPVGLEASPLSIFQLVEKGMEQEMQSACSRLMESLEALHTSFPQSVNTDPQECGKALARLNSWFDSPRFKLAGQTPDFLKQLDQWMSANREQLNRAEVISFYVIYGFQQYESPSYPSSPYMENIHWEVMFHAHQYEEDLVRLAGMPPLTKVSSPPEQCRPKSSQFRLSGTGGLFLLLLMIIICTVSIIFISFSQASPSTDQTQTVESEYRENISSVVYPQPT